MSDEPLAVGDLAPDVAGELVFPDGTIETVALSDLFADGPVLLSFYTADFTPDCIEEWCSFRDFEWFSANDDVQIVGASRSGEGSHRRFIDYLDLGFPLYSDADLAIADGFGVRYRAFGVTARARRSCFLLDGEGVVRYRWLGEHWLDPTRDRPDVEKLYEEISAVLADEGTTDESRAGG